MNKHGIIIHLHNRDVLNVMFELKVHSTKYRRFRMEMTQLVFFRNVAHSA